MPETSAGDFSSTADLLCVLAAQGNDEKLKEAVTKENCNWRRRENSETPLMCAAKAPNDQGYHCVRHLLKLGAQPWLMDASGNTAPCLAAIADNWKVLKCFSKDDLSQSGEFTNTPLMQAARYTCLNAVKELVDIGVDILARDAFGRTAVDYASDPAVVALLTNAQNLLAYTNETPNFDSDCGNDSDTARLLCSLASSGKAKRLTQLVTQQNCNWWWGPYQLTPLLAAASAVGDVGSECARLLLRLGADPESTDSCGCTAAFRAAGADNTAVLQLLLPAGLNVAGFDGRTPLMEAVRRGHVASVRLLIGSGADVEARDSCGRLAADFAAVSSSHTVRQLLQAAAAQTQLDTRHMTDPEASEQKIAKLLCELAAEGNVRGLAREATQDNCNLRLKTHTPLMFAAEVANSRGIDCVSLLLALGADPLAKDCNGATAAHRAARANNVAVLKLLTVDCINEVNNRGQTPLIVAASRGHIDAVKQLIRSGADLRMKDHFNRTALTFCPNGSKLSYVMHKAAVDRWRKK